MFRVLTQAKYDHVGMVVRHSDGKLSVFESLRESGVALCDWERFVTKKWYKLYHSMAYRRLSCSREEPLFTDTVNNFIK